MQRAQASYVKQKQNPTLDFCKFSVKLEQFASQVSGWSKVNNDAMLILPLWGPMSTCSNSYLSTSIVATALYDKDGILRSLWWTN